SILMNYARKRLLGFETAAQFGAGKTATIAYQSYYPQSWAADWSIRWVGNAAATGAVLSNGNIKLNYNTTTKQFTPEANGQTVANILFTDDNNSADPLLTSTWSTNTLRYYQDGEPAGSVVIAADFANT